MACVAQIRERRDPRRHPAFELRFRRGKALAKFVKRIAADHRRQQQPVRLQRAADLREDAGQIIDELQRERGYDEIERFLLKRQNFLRISQDIEVCEGFETVGERLSQGIAGCPDVGGLGKIPLHCGQPLRHLFGHTIEQEGDRPLFERTALPRPQQSAVKQGWRGGDRMGSHAGWLRRSMAPWQSSLYFPFARLERRAGRR